MRKIWFGGLLFFGLYFVFFLTFITAYPGIVQDVWNLSALSGILILEMTRLKKIAVIGAGIAGLICGHELQKAGFAVTVYEKENFVTKKEKNSAEYGASHFFSFSCVYCGFKPNISLSQQ